MSHTTIDRISGIELFKGCRQSNLKCIDELGTAVALPAGRTVCFEGEPGSEFFVLLDGVVDVRKSTHRVAQLHVGAWFGETALIHGVERQATLTTATPSTVIVFSRREFTSLCRTAPTVCERLEQTAALYLHGAAPTANRWYEVVWERWSSGAGQPTAFASSRDAG